MTFERRLWTLGLLVLIAVATIGIGKYYSSSLVEFVVEQTLIEKAPPGSDPGSIRGRLHLLLSGKVGEKERLSELLFLSQYLEKAQKLTPTELDELLERTK